MGNIKYITAKKIFRLVPIAHRIFFFFAISPTIRPIPPIRAWSQAALWSVLMNTGLVFEQRYGSRVRLKLVHIKLGKRSRSIFPPLDGSNKLAGCNLLEKIC